MHFYREVRSFWCDGLFSMMNLHTRWLTSAEVAQHYALLCWRENDCKSTNLWFKMLITTTNNVQQNNSLQFTSLFIDNSVEFHYQSNAHILILLYHSCAMLREWIIDYIVRCFSLWTHPVKSSPMLKGLSCAVTLVGEIKWGTSCRFKQSAALLFLKGKTLEYGRRFIIAAACK